MYLMDKKVEFFAQANLHGYEGKYIAIVDEKIVASGDNARIVFEQAKKKTGKTPTIAKVPTEDAFVFMAG